MWLAAADGGPPLPVVFFYGAEFAPYAAVQRWPLILALSRFGTFNQLGLMQSSATTAFANLSTFTFWNVSYTSKYLILESVERYSSLNPTGARYLRLQPPDARQAAAIASYGAGANTFALLDVANRYVLNGASFAPGVLAGLSQSQIAGDLDTPASPLTQAVVTAANEITASICAVDGDKPDAVCESHGVAGGGRGTEDHAPALSDAPRTEGAAWRSAGPAIEHELALQLVQAAPDPVRLTNPDGVIEALAADAALVADGLGPHLAQGLLLLALRVRRREEHRCLRSPARCLQLPHVLSLVHQTPR